MRVIISHWLLLPKNARWRIIRLARTLHLDVIAEGIETEVQRDLLVSMGCQFGQGYLLAMPVPADQAKALIRVGHSLVPELPRVST